MARVIQSIFGASAPLIDAFAPMKRSRAKARTGPKILKFSRSTVEGLPENASLRQYGEALGISWQLLQTWMRGLARGTSLPYTVKDKVVGKGRGRCVSRADLIHWLEKNGRIL